MQGKMVIDGKEYTVNFEANDTVHQLVWEHFPLEMKMQAMNGNEMYYYLPTEVRFNKSVKDIHSGDIKLYGDDCLVLFFKDTKTHYKYTDIGRIENPVDLDVFLEDKKSADVTFLLK